VVRLVFPAASFLAPLATELLVGSRMGLATDTSEADMHLARL
jgi:hypothetical protein